MQIKRKVRNTACWLLATVIILLGGVKRARNESFQDGIITSIYFHNPNKKLFRKTVVWLKKNGYSFISGGQLREILGKQMPCPRGAVWLSLDDGWKGNLENVIPTAVEHDIPVTIFICTDAAENGTFWWTKVDAYARLLPAELRRIEAIKRLPEDSRSQVLELIAQAEPKGDSGREAMTVEDVRRLSAIPQVTIGSHTVTHPILPNCHDHQIAHELGESKRKLEEWTGKQINTFAYPNGSFDGRERRFLKKYGYELAVTIENNLARSNGDCYQFPRTDVMDDGSFAENLCHALGVWEPVVNKVKRVIKPGG